MEHYGRMKTGVKGLDEMLNGGLISGRPYMISGVPGSGKTTLCMQFCLEGVKNGETVLFVAIDEPPNEIKANYSVFNWDLSNVRILDANSDIRRPEPTPILDVTSKSMAQNVSDIDESIRKTKDFESVIITVHSLQQAIKFITDREQIDRLVIDSMSGVKYFCMEGLDENISIQSFIRFLAELKVTTLLAVETGNESPLTAELFLSRGEIRLHRWWSGGMLHRGISIELIRGSQHDEALRPMEITNSGIVVYPGISNWKKKTSFKTGKVSNEDVRNLKSDLNSLLALVEESSKESKELKRELCDVCTALASAKTHLDCGEILYASEITSYCLGIIDNCTALKTPTERIVVLENTIRDCRKNGLEFPEAEELLKKAKVFANKGKNKDALKHIDECDALLKQKIAEVEERQKSGQTAVAAHEKRIGTAPDDAMVTAMEKPSLHESVAASSDDHVKPLIIEKKDNNMVKSGEVKEHEIKGIPNMEKPHHAVHPAGDNVEKEPVITKKKVKKKDETEEIIDSTVIEKAVNIVEQPAVTGKVKTHEKEEHTPPHAHPPVNGVTPVLIHPLPPPSDGLKMCPICRGELKFIEKYNRFYCFRCKKYAPKNI